jgi:hypothetical protein
MSRIIAGFFGVLLSFKSFAVQPSDFHVQDWWAPGEVGLILFESRNLFPDMRVSKDDNFQKTISPAGSFCLLRAAFPKDRAQSAKSFRNKITCYLRDIGGNYALLSLSLKNVDFQAWGSTEFYEYREKEGLPQNFHFRNQKINESLLTAMSRFADKSSSVAGRKQCSVDRDKCRHFFYFKNPNDLSGKSRFLECVMTTIDEAVDSSKCIFHYPEAK